MHPEIRLCGFFFPLGPGAVEQVDIPGEAAQAKDALPQTPGVAVVIPEVAESSIAEFGCSLEGGVAVVLPDDWRPDKVDAKVLVGNMFEDLLDVGEPPTARRSGGGQNRDEADVTGVTVEHRTKRIDILNVSKPGFGGFLLRSQKRRVGPDKE